MRSGGPVRTVVTATSVALVAALVSTGLGSAALASPRSRGGGFAQPHQITIDGYTGSAMEPFVTSDGSTLLFNTSNTAPNIPAVQEATRVAPTVFRFRGPLKGANQAGSLSGTPSVDDGGNLYFITTRSYAADRSTVYSGRLADGVVSGVHPVAGVSAGAFGIVDFDVEVSPDGSRLYVSVGQFDGGPPTSAQLVVYDKVGSGFAPDRRSARMLRAVNRPGMLTYAASISSDNRELFFTAAPAAGGSPSIYRATRSGPTGVFGHVQPVSAISGFAEAPALSTSGTILTYHLVVHGSGQIWQVTRP